MLLVVLFMVRLVRTPSPRGYTRVSADLRECCRQLDLQLPPPLPVAASSMSVARATVGAGVLRRVQVAVLVHAN